MPELYLSPRVRRWLLASPLALLFVAPGWSGRLEPVSYDEMWDRLRSTRSAVGVASASADDGGQWHSTYVEDGFAETLTSIGLRHVLPALRAPDYVAHIPAGGLHPDGHYRVTSSLRWPWWWPGGGMDWSR